MTTKLKEGFRIVRLLIANVGKIETVELNPENLEPVILTGDNGAGKSTIIESIWLALKNRFSKPDTIRKGADKAKVTLTITNGETTYDVERRMTKKGGESLYVRDAAGNQLPKAQTFLDSLMGALTFDPMEFARMKDDKQLGVLRTLAGIDFTDLDEKRKALYDERTAVNKAATAAKVRLQSMPEPGKDTPTVEVSASELMAELEKAQELKSAADWAKHVIIETEASITVAKRNLDEADKRIAELEEQLAAAKQARVNIAAQIPQLEGVLSENKTDAAKAEEYAAKADIDGIKARLNSVDATNRAVRDAAKWREARKEMLDRTAESEKLSAQIEKLDEQKVAMVAAAKLPLHGLTLGDDHIEYNGVPFASLSTAEQIRCSTAIAMAANPDLKIILIREGALVNKAGMEEMVKAAQENGYQLWIEKFSEEPEDHGLHIVDGAIRFEDGKPVGETEQPAAEESDDQPGLNF